MTTADNTVQYGNGPGSKNHRHSKKKGRWWKVLLIVLVVLVIIRLILPHFVLKYVNKALAQSKEYPGRIEDVDLALIRGAYVIKHIRIDKADTLTGKRDSIPFFTSPSIDLSVEWNALFKGRIVGEISVEEPRLNFVKSAPNDRDMTNDTSDFKDVIRDLMPLRINRFEIHQGSIHYMDYNSKPKVDLAITDIEVLAHNLSNASDSGKTLPANMDASARAYGGQLDLQMRFDALNKQPTFDMSAKLEGVDMTRLNDFFRAYGNFDVNRGNFGLYTEFAAKEGKFKGYVKPLIRNLDVVEWNSKSEGNFGQKMWESVIGVTAEIFENQRKEQLATKIPINGRFNDPSVNLWNAVSYVLRNAFVHALQPSIDQTISIGGVEDVETEKTFLQKIFGKKKKDEDKEQRKRKDEEDPGKK